MPCHPFSNLYGCIPFIVFRGRLIGSTKGLGPFFRHAVRRSASIALFLPGQAGHHVPDAISRIIIEDHRAKPTAATRIGRRFLPTSLDVQDIDKTGHLKDVHDILVRIADEQAALLGIHGLLGGKQYAQAG